MPSGQTSVLFQVAARGVPRRALRQFGSMLEMNVARGRPFCCVVTGDYELQRLNRRFRKSDYATDVLSFPCDAGMPACGADGASLGEIAISYDRAKEQAKVLGHTSQEEVRILMLHGVLHLIGMDHERDRGEMARAERRWRKRFGLPAGLIERARR